MHNELWSTGIVLKCNEKSWWTTVEFRGDDALSTDDLLPDGYEGKVSTRYALPLSEAIDRILELCARIGVTFPDTPYSRYLYYEGDGESKDWPPPNNWRRLLREQAERIGWQTYRLNEPGFDKPREIGYNES